MRGRALFHLEEHMMLTLVLASAVSLGAVLATNSAEVKLPRSVQHGEFDLAISAKQAFPLFSPEGERPWAAGWDPKPVFPAEEAVRWQRNAVFTTDHNNEHLTWWILDVDRATRTADYLNVGNGRISRITVHVQSIDESHCHVDVTYILSATEASASELVQRANSEQMRHRMIHWKQAIEEAIAKGLPAIPE
jgi:hypothetical protein